MDGYGYEYGEVGFFYRIIERNMHRLHCIAWF